MTVSRRDYFAAHADISWIATSTPAKASAKTGVPIPSVNPIPETFWEEVEVKWRWKYANLMDKGS